MLNTTSPNMSTSSLMNIYRNHSQCLSSTQQSSSNNNLLTLHFPEDHFILESYKSISLTTWVFLHHHNHLLHLTKHGEDLFQLFLPHLPTQASHKNSARNDERSVHVQGHGGCRRQGGHGAGLHDWLEVGERDPVVLKHFDNYLKQENEGNLHTKVLFNKTMKIAI